jgi:hypothetical protein
MTLNYKLVAGCSLLVAGSYKKCILEVIISLQKSRAKSLNMSNYKDLEIYQIAFELARKVHLASLNLPQFELYEQGSQIRRSSKSIKDQIAEG